MKKLLIITFSIGLLFVVISLFSYLFVFNLPLKPAFLEKYYKTLFENPEGIARTTLDGVKVGLEQAGIIDSVPSGGVREELNTFFEQSRRIALGELTSEMWLWDRHMVSALVVDKYISEGGLGVSIYFPDDKDFSKEYHKVVVTCAPEYSSIVSPKDQVVEEVGVSVLDEVSAGDFLYGICSDRNCTNLGELCVLVSERF